MTSKVIPFPTAEVQTKALKDELEKTVACLDEQYTLLDQLHQGLHVMEQASDELETAYDEALKEYVERVGFENVEVRFLHYSRVVAISYDEEGKIQFKWIDEEENW
jgi:hypothetical protein